MDYYFTSDYVDIYYDDAIEGVHVVVKTFLDLDEFKTGMQHSFGLALEKNTRKWLYDTRESGPLPDEGLQWAAKELLPDFYKKMSGGRKVAFVVGENLFAQLTISEITGDYRPEDETRFFARKDEAVEWLKSLEN